MWQTLGVFEISHAVFNLSPGASVTAVCVTFAERLMLIVACLLPFYELRTNAHVCAPFIAWSATNTVRFACVALPPPLPFLLTRTARAFAFTCILLFDVVA